MTILRRQKEAPIEARVVEYAKRIGVRSLKLELHHDAGWPDRLFILPRGRTLWVEFKAPGGPLRELQNERRGYLLAFGHDVRRFDDYNAVMTAIAGRILE